jgi:dTDP-4-amino-4,6-dideoxygalactose transaminase
LQAAVLRVKLKKLSEWNMLRKKAASVYGKLLRGSGVILPTAVPEVKHVYHAYVIRAKKRDMLLEKFKEKGIGSIIYYPIPLHLQKAYKDFGYRKGDFPVAEKVAAEILSLPIFPQIKESQIKKVAEVINDYR